MAKKPREPKKPKKGADTSSPRTTEQLSEDQQQQLFFQHKQSYEQKLAAKKAADAAFKNACKIAKAELGKRAVDRIKLAIALGTEEGDADLRARIEGDLQVARWMGSSVGTQFEMFDADRTPAVDRAFEDGKRARFNNEPRKPPHAPSTPQYTRWMEGYDSGQETISAGFKSTEKPEGSVPRSDWAKDLAEQNKGVEQEIKQSSAEIAAKRAGEGIGSAPATHRLS
jgi:hypothetical protein